MTLADTRSDRPSALRGWWTVSVLSLLYILSFVDRVILALLVSPLKADLKVSDVQLGLLFGPAFAIFYAILGLPIARLADRGNRKRLVALGVFIWGTATVASGFAGSFWVLVTLRIGLAIGEAALTPSAHSLIGDLFAPKQRALAASIYSAMGMVGASGAYILGAAVMKGADHWAGSAAATHSDTWRLVLIIVGAPSLLVGAIFALTTREPKREHNGGDAPSAKDALLYLRKHSRLFGGLFLGAGFIQAVGYAYAAWGPEFIHRQFSWSIPKAGLAFGIAGLVGASLGTIAAPMVTKFLQDRGVAKAVPLTSLVSLSIGAALAALAPLQHSPGLFLMLYVFAHFFLTGAANNVLVGLQRLAPKGLRATFVALLLTCYTLLGLGIGPVCTALISKWLGPSDGSLGIALALLVPLVATPAFLLFLWSLGAQNIVEDAQPLD